MTKKEMKELENYVMLQRLVANFNGRLKAHLHEREILLKEHEWLLKKIDKALNKAEKEDESDV